MDNLINSIGIIIYTTLLYTPPLLFAALGSCFSENSGVVNIGIEGMMTIGAFVGATVSHFTSLPWISFFCGGLAGAVFGALHAWATVKLNADQTISGTAINFLAPGVAILLARALFDSSDTVPLSTEQKIPLLLNGVFPTNSAWGNFLKNTFSNYATTYMVFIAVLVVWFVFYKTRFGLRMRACGEHPAACDTLGINVLGIRFFSVCMSGFLAGLGGASVTMATMNQFRPTSIVGHIRQIQAAGRDVCLPAVRPVLGPEDRARREEHDFAAADFDDSVRGYGHRAGAVRGPLARAGRQRKALYQVQITGKRFFPQPAKGSAACDRSFCACAIAQISSVCSCG